MKCPKCNYNSFDDYDACPKCANDLVKHKATFGIAGVILSPVQREALLAEMAPPKVEPVSEPVPEVAEITETVPAQNIFADEQSTPAQDIFADEHEAPAENIFASAQEAPAPVFGAETTSFSSAHAAEEPTAQEPEDFVIETMEHFHNSGQEPAAEQEPAIEDENPFAFLETTIQEADTDTTPQTAEDDNLLSDLLETTIQAEDPVAPDMATEDDFLQELGLDSLSFAEEEHIDEDTEYETESALTAEEELASLFGELKPEEK